MLHVLGYVVTVADWPAPQPHPASICLSFSAPLEISSFLRLVRGLENLPLCNVCCLQYPRWPDMHSASFLEVVKCEVQQFTHNLEDKLPQKPSLQGRSDSSWVFITYSLGNIVYTGPPRVLVASKEI